MINIAYALITEDWTAESRAKFDELLATEEERRAIGEKRQDAEARATASFMGHNVDRMVVEAAERRAYWLDQAAKQKEEEKGKAS